MLKKRCFPYSFSPAFAPQPPLFFFLMYIYLHLNVHGLQLILFPIILSRSLNQRTPKEPRAKVLLLRYHIAKYLQTRYTFNSKKLRMDNGSRISLTNY